MHIGGGYNEHARTTQFLRGERQVCTDGVLYARSAHIVALVLHHWYSDDL